MARANLGRVAAARALVEVDGGAHVEDVLARLAPEGADRGLAWHLALGVLRRRGALDALLAPHLKRPIHDLDPPVRAVLRIGAFEQALSRTPAHAAVSQAVEVVRRLKAPRAAGLVNAVLRRVEPDALREDPLVDVPRWLAKRWRDAGPWLARTREPAPLCGVWRDPAQPVPELAARPVSVGDRAVPGAFVVDAPEGPIDKLPGFAEGRWWVMDPAAAAVADLLWDARAPGAGARVLDACAAPGGKSLRLVSRGAQVTAVDASEKRLERAGEGSRRTGLPLARCVHDWLDGPAPSLGTFDAVLVDAPCTGLGTIRRHPEIKWRRGPSDPAAMGVRQRMILEAAAAHVAPDGVLVYAVCSPMEEEGPPVVASLPGWTVADTLVTFPPRGDEDAFQAFVLRRAPGGD